MFSENLTGEMNYRMIVPTSPFTNTHDPEYLNRVNGPSGWEHLLNAINQDDRYWLLKNELLLARNKSPHGLGGLLLWDFGAKNIFDLDISKQQRFHYYLGQIESILRKEYGEKYHILLGMCLSENPGSRKRQSIAYSHAHISLIPRIGKIQGHLYWYDNGLVVESMDTKRIRGAQYRINEKTAEILNGFGCKKQFHTGIIIQSHDSSESIQFPVIYGFDNKDVAAILQAKNDDGEPVGSTISAIITETFKTRIAISLGTPGYLHFDGIELARQQVGDEQFDEFNNFGRNIFDNVVMKLQATL